MRGFFEFQFIYKIKLGTNFSEDNLNETYHKASFVPDF